MTVHLSSSLSTNSVQNHDHVEVSRGQDLRVTEVRERVLRTIRQHVPIETLFTPELKIDLAVFIKDQMLFRRIAEFLAPLVDKGEVNSEFIAKFFSKSDLLSEITAMSKQDPTLLTSFYEACADVLNKKSFPNKLRAAIEGRIYTLRNAFVALHNPQAILNSQAQNQLTLQDVSSIKKEGASFIRESLNMHLNALTAPSDVSFKQQLIDTAAQLIPFVRNVTRSYLKENFDDDCPDNPLTFRNPTGYNRHGILAATVMEACLNALGHKTQLLMRSDLEPKMTLSTAHSIVEVTAPDQSKYIVDPCYVQFHKDVCLDQSSVPTFPVLVLAENEIDRYIEENLMHHWRANNELVNKRNKVAIDTLFKQDQHLPFRLQEYLPEGILPPNREAWVKTALTRVWDFRTHAPMICNMGFQEIFLGLEGGNTYDSIRAMGIGALTHYSSLQVVEDRLKNMLRDPKLRGQNSSEALSLIAQLPTKKRGQYERLFDIDPNVKGIDITLNAYFRFLRKQVNPQGKDKRVIYACSGSDCTSVLLATDAQDITFVDLTENTFYNFKLALKTLKESSEREIRKKLEGAAPGFFDRRMRYGGGISQYQEGKMEMIDLPFKLFFDLREIGVDLNKVVLTPNPKGAGIRIDFPWQYHGAAASRNRSLTLVTADITKPNEYPDLLKRKVEGGFDIFYMKAGFRVPQQYPEFLPHITKFMKEGGWLMTADKTFFMEAFNPETCLEQNNLLFLHQESEELRLFEENLRPPYHPTCTISLLDQIVRKNRSPGSDISYWSILSLRQKIDGGIGIL